MRRNRGEFDAWLYAEDEETLHPDASLFTDSLTHYLTLEPGPHPRYRSTATVASTAARATSFRARHTKTWRADYVEYEVSRDVYRSVFGGGEGYSSRLNRLSSSVDTLPAWVPGTTVDLAYRVTGDGLYRHPYEVRWFNAPVASGEFMGTSLESGFVAAAGVPRPGGRVVCRVADTAGRRVAFGQLTYAYERSGEVGGKMGISVDLVDTPRDTRLSLWGFGAPSAAAVYALAEREALSFPVTRGSATDTLFVDVEAGAVADGVDVYAATGASLRAWSYVPLALPTGTSYVLLTSRALRATVGPRSAIEDYAAYRASAEGGGYGVAIVYVEDLFDEFSFGISRHAAGLRNSLAAVRAAHPTLGHVFVVGKGRAFTSLRTASQLADPASATAFVPTFGVPASDALLVADPGDVVPRVAIARLPAQSLAEVAAYLRKVRTYEAGLTSPAIDDLLWRKRAVHLTGGATPGEQQAFRAFMESLGRQLEDTPTGAEVAGFNKVSNQPVETSQLDGIFEVINAGAGLVSYYGHGSVSVLGFNIENPERFENAGRTPVFMIYGCSAGNVFTAGQGVAERFLALPEVGMGFVTGNVGVSYPSDNQAFMPLVYARYGDAQAYGATIGGVMRSALEAFVDGAGGNPRRLAYAEQYQMIGDPAYRVYAPLATDLTWDAGTAQVAPGVVTPDTDSVSVAVDLLSLGRRVDSADVTLRRELPDGSVDLVRRRLTDVATRTRLAFALPSRSELVGQQAFTFEVDEADDVMETLTPQSETNNTLAGGGLRLAVISDAAAAVYPVRDALHDCSRPLLAVSADPLAPSRTYRFELATDPSFATLIASEELSGRGGVIAWTPSGMRQNGTYAWRVAPVSGDSVLAAYDVSRFTCRGAAAEPQTRLGLLAPFQFEGGEGDLARVDSGWRFPVNVQELELINKSRTGADGAVALLNGGISEGNYGNALRAGVWVGVLDPLSLVPVQNPPGGLYGSETPAGWRVRNAFSFRTDSAQQRAEIVRFLEERVPTGAYAYLVTIRGDGESYSGPDWDRGVPGSDSTLLKALSSRGAALAAGLLDGGEQPYAFVWREGDGPLAEQVGADSTDVIRVAVSLAGPWFEGTYLSRALPPADSVAAAKLQVDDARALDSLSFYWALLGERDGVADTLAAGRTLTLEVADSVGVGAYSALRAYWRCRDLSTRRPLNVTGFTLAANPLPDLVWDLGPVVDDDRRTGRFGDTLALTTRLFNASDRVVEDVAVVYEPGGPVPPELRGLDTLFDFHQLAPLSAAESTLRVLNTAPRDASVSVVATALAGQREARTSNNVCVRALAFEADLVAPTLSVFADGQPLRDGQLMSAQPEIVFVARDDRAAAFPLGAQAEQWTVEHTDPSGVTRQLSHGAGADLQLAATPAGDASAIRWTPSELADGLHVLRVVVADDAGNRVSLEATRSFEVVGALAISDLVAEPNPSSGPVRFAYELAGDVALTDFTVVVADLTGREVRRLGSAELGALYPGRRFTRQWDGASAGGEPLRAGTYVYRFLLGSQPDGREVGRRASELNGLLSGRAGKLVVAR